MTVHKWGMVQHKHGMARLFSVVPSERTRVNEHTLNHRKLCLKVRIHFFYCARDRQVAQRDCEIITLGDTQKLLDKS